MARSVTVEGTPVRLRVGRGQYGGFVAQCLDFDYLATGETARGAVANFKRALAKTFQAIRRRGRTLDPLLNRPALPVVVQQADA